MTMTYSDIWSEIDEAVNANGEDLAEGIDVDAITREWIDTYGLISIDAKDEDGEELVEPATFWAMVARHDSTQA